MAYLDALTRVGVGGPARQYSGFAASASVSLAGTAASGLTETQVVTGGETIILTLTADTWVTAGATFDAQRQNIIDGLDADGAELTGWNAVVRDSTLQVADVVRTSDTVVTITLSAAATYDVTANETVAVTVPASALAGGNALVAAETVTITASIVSVYNIVISPMSMRDIAISPVVFARIVIDSERSGGDSKVVNV